MTGVIHGLLLFLFRQYCITKFLNEHYGDFVDKNAKVLCQMVHRKLEKYYFQEVRPAIKRKEDVGEESDKNAPVLSVTDEEDIAGPNAGGKLLHVKIMVDYHGHLSMLKDEIDKKIRQTRSRVFTS